MKKPRFKIPAWELPEYCSNPDCGSKGSIKEGRFPSVMLIKGEEVEFISPKFQCEKCGATFQSPEQATEGVKIALDKFNSK